VERKVSASTPTAGHDDHAVVFYADDCELAERVGEFLCDALRTGGVAVLIATPAHRLALDAWMGLAGFDVAAATAQGSYVELDAAETLAKFMVNDWPDPAEFWQVISPVIQQASESATPVHVFGEMVALLWEAGQAAAAIDLEALWNEMASRHSFSLLCGYSASSVSDPELSDALTQVCLAHTAASGVPPSLGQVALPD
jgi:MEDS: MEthanogen/methylotroph, DcmR Sensory domain